MWGLIYEYDSKDRWMDGEMDGGMDGGEDK